MQPKTTEDAARLEACSLILDYVDKAKARPGAILLQSKHRPGQLQWLFLVNATDGTLLAYQTRQHYPKLKRYGLWGGWADGGIWFAPMQEAVNGFYAEADEALA